MPKKSSDSSFTPNTKTFVKLMAKRDAIQKVIDRQTRKMEKVNKELGKFGPWIQTITAPKQ